MSLCTIGTRSVVTIEADAPAAAVACKMNDRSVGSVVVARRGQADRHDHGPRPRHPRALQGPGSPSRRPPGTSCPRPSPPSPRVRTRSGPRAACARPTSVACPSSTRAENLVGIVCLDDLAYHLARCHQEMAEAIAAFPIPHEGG